MARYGNAALQGAAPGLSRLAQALGGAGGAYQQGYDQELAGQSKLAQAMAAARASDAAARAHNATADQTTAETGVLQGRPELIDESIAAQTGTTLPMLAAVRDFIKTGQRPMRELQGPVTEDGIGAGQAPVVDDAIQSKIAQALARSLPMRTNLKDTNVNDQAKAAGEYRAQDLSDAIIQGRANRNVVGGAQAAVEAKPLFHVSGDGAVLDQYAGSLNEDGGLAKGSIAYKKAQAGAQNANAVQSYASAENSRASADAHRASAAKTRLDVEQGVKSGQIQIVTADDGSINLVNKATGVSRKATDAEGKTLMGKGKELNEGQAKDNGYGSRMMEADRLLTALQGKYSPAAVNAKVGADGVPLVGGAAGAVGNWLLTDEGQQAEQAQRDFINAVLRRESGAAISPSEFANAGKQYFPQPNDKPDTLAQKARNRKLATEGVFGSVPANKRGLPSLTNPGPAPAAAPAARTVVRTGTANGRKVVQYSDGSIENAD